MKKWIECLFYDPYRYPKIYVSNVEKSLTKKVQNKYSIKLYTLLFSSFKKIVYYYYVLRRKALGDTTNELFWEGDGLIVIYKYKQL